MPGFDGTGPMGRGPMTGGGRGFCNPYGPLRTAGFPPPTYGPRPITPLLSTVYPQVPAYAGSLYRPAWFRPGFRPQTIGAMPRFWAGRGGGRGRCRFPFYPW